jgi:hypothetical protein
MCGRFTGLCAAMFWAVMVAVASGQSLAEVARREAARREGLTSTSPVLTNADLPASAVLSSGTPADSAPAAEDAASVDADAGDQPLDETTAAREQAPGTPGEPAERDARGEVAASRDDEAGWRARATRVNGQLAEARAQVRQLRALSDRLALEMLAADRTLAARAARERDEVKARVAVAEAAEAEAMALRRVMEHDARVGGVPAAWIQ